MNRYFWLFCALPITGEICGTGSVHAEDSSGEVEIGVGYLSDDAYQYGNRSGVNEQGLTPLLNVELGAGAEPASGATGYWWLEVERLGLDTGRVELEAGEQGRQRLRLGYREVPRYRFDDAFTPLRGPGSKRLPPGWEATDATTGGMTRLEESLVEVNLWQQRRSLGVEYQHHLDRQWTLSADFRRDTLEGTRALGGATGATGGNVRALLLPAPLDYETQIALLALAYTGTGYHWSLGYQGSFFNNRDSALGWPTPFAAHPQWAPGSGYPGGQNQMALEPDNQAHQLRVNGSLTLAGSTRLHMDAALGRQTQDEAFLPYTVNPQIDIVEPLPRDSLDARVNTSHVKARLTSRPASGLNLIARLGYRDRDNQTPIDVYQRVRSDASPQQAFMEARLNRPYSLTEREASTDATYRLARGLRLEAGYEHTQTDRDYSEVARTEEHGFSLGVRSTRWDRVMLAMNYRHLDRHASAYVGNRPLIDTRVPGSVGEEDFENHPLLRKYYLTDRDRDQWRLRLDWYLSPSVSLGSSVTHNRDDYPSGYFGLTDSEMVSATADITYTPAEAVRLTGFVNRDRYQRNQAGRSFRGSVPEDAANAERNWNTRARDHFDVWGGRLDWEDIQPSWVNGQAGRRLDLSLSFTHSRSNGEIVTETGPALDAAPLPELVTRLDSIHLGARYHLSPRSSLRLEVERERYRSDDFALDDLAPGSHPNVLLMGQSSPDYRATWVALGYRLSF
ncbi:MtrB/PioB family decaheme-associated outer membrane protein [Marinimicrobium agarilyticum]|uniref:MtrB/PioB family decaheme-associated outer membrane protein n=1 Tax=Marinimicrobium agarilyticum TaxID=306546 RepID=UPI000413D7AD|nr:MtrB/PioB family decaheme-associated outer membrane protein [Marinimicrobium agarilyticum]